MNRIAVMLILGLLVSGCGWSDKRGWEGFIDDLEYRGFKGRVTVIPPSSDELWATNITYTIETGNQSTQVITILEFRHTDDAYRQYDILKPGEQTNFVVINCGFVLTCDFHPMDTNRASEVRKIFSHHRRARLTEQPGK